MRFINYILGWLSANQSRLESEDIQMTIVGPADIQTKKSIVIDATAGRFNGLFICWDTGECEVEVADLEAALDAPEDIIIQHKHYEFENTEELDVALHSFFETLT